MKSSKPLGKLFILDGQAAGLHLIRLPLSETEAAALGRLEEWKKAVGRRQRRLSKKQAETSQLRNLVAQAEALATQHGWSEKQLCRKMGLARITFRRMRAGLVNPVRWRVPLAKAIQKASA